MKDKQVGRIIYLDVARGLAVWCVVLVHMNQLINDKNFFYKFIWTFTVPIFFVISGMLLFYNRKWEKQSIKEVIINKAKAYLYPYLTFSVLSVIFNIFYLNILSAAKEIIDTILGIGVLALWFIPALFISEVIFAIIMKKARKQVPVWLLIMLAITVIFNYVFTGWPSYSNHTIRFIVNIFNVINHSLIAALFLFVGYSWAKFRQKSDMTTWMKALIMVVGLAIGLALAYSYDADIHTSQLTNPVVFYIGSIASSLGILLMSEMLLEKVKILAYSGINSLVIFSTHLNFRIVNIGYFVAKFVGAHGFLLGLIDFVVIVVIELLIVYVINHYAKWLVSYKQLQQLKSAK